MKLNPEKHKALDVKRERVKVFNKENEETKPVIVNKSTSVENVTARTRIASVVVNLVTLLMITLSQR